jgi:preprotein translocase subunit SecE
MKTDLKHSIVIVLVSSIILSAIFLVILAALTEY